MHPDCINSGAEQNNDSGALKNVTIFYYISNFKFSRLIGAALVVSFKSAMTQFCAKLLGF